MRRNGTGFGLVSLILFALAFVNVKFMIDMIAREQMMKDKPSPKFVVASRMWNAAGAWTQNMIVAAIAAAIANGYEIMAAREWMFRHERDGR